MALPSFVNPAEFPFSPRLVEVGSNESLSVVDEGSGLAVVFSHGTPTWSYEWRAMMKALRPGYRIIAPDHLGFGLSPRPSTADYRPEAHARRFASLLDTLALDRYHLVVHDYGGPFALDAALRRPERVASLTILNSFAWAFGDSPRTRVMAWLAGSRLFRWAYGALNLSFKIARSAWGDPRSNNETTWAPYLPIFPDADSRRRVLWALAKAMSGSAAYCASLWDRRAALSQIPVHLIWGLRDTAFPPTALERFNTAFPQATVLRLPTAGHWPHEEQPAVCADSLASFLGRTHI